MPHQGRLGTATAEESQTSTAIPVGQAVPAGHTVLGAVAWSQDSASIPAITSVTDSRGNAYTVDAAAGAGNSTASCSIFRARVATALQSGDSITVTISSPRIRWCLQADAFDDLIAAPLDRTAANDTPARSSSLSTGTTLPTQQAKELAYAAFAFGRGDDQDITGVGGWNAGPQVATAAASARRGLQVAHVYLDAAGAVEGTATTDAATTYSGCVATYRVVTDQTLGVGRAEEIDLARTITPVRTVPVGRASELDAASLIFPGQIIPIGQAAEHDAATRLAVPLGRAGETDAAGQIKPIRLVPIGQASETDTATALARHKTKAFGQAAETDDARAVGPRVALAPETLLNGVPTPLGVRIYNNFTPALDVWVTKAVDDFSFRSSIPGGFASATITLHRPSIVGNPSSGYLFNADESQFDQLARLFNRVQIVDMRSAEIVWEGRIEGPRRSSDSDTWELSCLGAAVLASDIQRPMFYIDSSVESWLQTPENWWQFQADEPSKTIEVRWEGDLIWPGPAGSGFALFQALTWQRGRECGLLVGRYDITFASSAPAGAGDQPPTHLWNSVRVGAITEQGADGEFHATNYTQNVRHWRRINGALSNFGATGGWQIDVNRIDIDMGVGNDAGFGDYTSAPDKVVGRIASPRVQVLRLDRTGAELTDPADYPYEVVTLQQIVEDVIGRFLVGGWNRGIFSGLGGGNRPFAGHVRPIDVYMDTSSTAAFSHLVYFDGTTAADILGDMMGAQPGAYWAIWESRYGATASASDRGLSGHRFEWATWPASWGYQASSMDGLEEQPSGEDLYNYVFYKFARDLAWDADVPGQKDIEKAFSARHAGAAADPDGFHEGNDLSWASVPRAVTVIREEPTDQATAAAGARDLLSRYRRTGNTGTITIRRPIHYYDPGETSYSGGSRMVQPWEIRPGKLIKITDVMPRGRIDAHPLGQTPPPEAHDGTVWRMVATEYSSSDNSCRVELDQPQAWEVSTQIRQAARPGGTTVSLGKSVTVLNSNPRFEDGATGWNAVNCTLTPSTEVPPPRGAAALKVTPDGVSSFGGADSDLTGADSVAADKEYVASGWIYSPAGWSTWRLNILWYDSAENLLSTSFGGVTTVAAAQWQYFELRATAPASASQARVSMRYQNSPSSGDIAYLWNVTLVDFQ